MKMTVASIAMHYTSMLSTASQPVFNRPVITEREYHISRALNLTLLSLMVVLSVATVGLKAMTLAFIEDNHDMGFVFETGDPEPTVLAALPGRLYTAPAKLAIVAGVVAFVIGVVHAACVLWDWKRGKFTQSYAFRRNSMFLHFCNSVLVLFSLVSIFITHKSTSHFHERYIMRQADRFNDPNNPFNNSTDNDGIRYNIGTFDLETWSCELKTVEGARRVWSEYERQCSIEMAGRILVIPFMITAFLIAGACIAQMMRCRRDANGERMKTEEVSMEMGKFNAI
ncbi:uncharacterized protein EI97DRAFT_451172 [Westerdykella ornata]|uniref:Uncharacterized protein n=1 Tax=Westerdykella ornata TaxID=318751 RepID=A0A6A6JH14_WESOR|nr:uncharacterized protein EI97DRAFT_451172 [Westerdykella ornata]KAF2275258.1 hypothetical protein EI97DRAFT_451172 [Westerdykella ornata]